MLAANGEASRRAQTLGSIAQRQARLYSLRQTVAVVCSGCQI